MKTFVEYVVESAEPAEKIETRVFEIPVWNMSYLEDKIAKLNKTAAKLGAAPIEMKIGKTITKKIKPGDPDRLEEPTYAEFVEVTLHGEAPKLSGWSFVGKREPMEGTTSIMSKSAPGHKMPKKYHDDHVLTCDHCKKSARRTATFVVKKGNKHMEVGRSCLKDFLGHANPSKYADYASILYDIESMIDEYRDEGYNGGHARRVSLFDLKKAMAVLVHLVVHKGFISKQAAIGIKEPTSHSAWQHFEPPPCPPGQNAREWYKSFHVDTDATDEKAAVEIIEWMKKHPKAGKEEFWTNVAKMAHADAIPGRMLGYMAAAVNTHQKDAGRVQQTQGLMASLKDEYLGNEGASVEFDATVISAFVYQGNWGTKNILTLKTDDGHLVKMFTMSGGGYRKDDKVHVKGKIGRNEIESYETSPFKGRKITTMAPRARVS